VANASGGHTFTRTFEEHLQAISTARRLRAQAGEAAEESPPPQPAPTPASPPAD